MRKILTPFLLIGVLVLISHPFGARAENQADLDKLSGKLTEISQIILSLQRQIEELTGRPSVSPALTLNKEIIQGKIEQGKEFLFRMENKDKHGFYKKYDAPTDSFEARLHTVYSASIIYTFLYIYDYEQDEKILEKIPDWGEFLISMQNRNEGSRAYGAFSYSYYLDTGEKEELYPVGTSALSIFTLLRLYELTDDKQYLESAKLAGDWLTTMQKENGAIKSYRKYEDDKWFSGTAESLLYNGQVLSALSKLYATTKEQKYYNTAQGIANYFTKKYEKERICPVASQGDCYGGYVDDDYRTKSPISNSWVVMSLLDFYRVSNNDYYKDIIFELSDLILNNQIKNRNNLLNYGTWEGAYSTSGIGWISEVMTEIYKFCQEEKRVDCDKYKDAVTRGIWWIIQNTYSKENSAFLKNPERAIGGIFWNSSNKYVRTDSVCHALNGYTIIISALEPGSLLPIKGD